MPVLLTSRSSRPKTSRAVAMTWSWWSGSSAWPATPSACSTPPRRSTASSSASGLRPVTTTRAPSATRRSAMPNPMPRLAPVTMATVWSCRPTGAPPRMGVTQRGGSEAGSEAEVAADELLHDLVGAGPDLGDAGVPPGAGDAVLVHEAVAAVELHALVEHVVLHLRRPPLGLGRVDRGELALGVRHDAVVDVRLGHLELGLHLGDLELVVLERADRLAEGLALLHVLDSLGEDLE